MKEYNYKGSTYLFDETDVPAGATPAKAEKPVTKAAKTPATKQAAKPANKLAPAADNK